MQIHKGVRQSHEGGAIRYHLLREVWENLVLLCLAQVIQALTLLQ